MPRRRPSVKAKSKSKPRPIDRKDSRIKRWDKPSDIELDEEDQFHASRDKILLDEGNEVDEDGEDEEEVFALPSLSDSDGDDDDAVDYDEHDLDGEDGMDVDGEDAAPKPAKSKSKSKTDAKKSKKEAELSDSEDEETWGRGKGAYYSSNAAQLDSDDEEANELEEKEAIRLQAKARDAMGDDDFGLGDVVDGEAEPTDDLYADQEESTKPPPKEIPRDKQTMLRALEKECPETLALARDWDETARNLMQTKARVESLDESETDSLELNLQHMYYQALLTYATTLAFYFHLRASEKFATRPELLRQHPILKRLLTLKEGLSTLENIGIGQAIDDDDDDDDLVDEEDEEDEETLLDGDDMFDLWSLIKEKGIDSAELADLLEDVALNPTSNSKSNVSPRSPLIRIPGKKQVIKKESPEERPKKKRKTVPGTSSPNSDRGTSPFDLVEPDYTRVARKKKSKDPTGMGAGVGAGVAQIHQTQTHTLSDLDPYGEVTALDHVDMSDKRARKKSLRFHVARIASAADRRSHARANAAGGDDDIPYRERRKEREARFEREQEKRKDRGELGAGGDDLDDVGPELVGEKKIEEKNENDRKAKRKRAPDTNDGGDDADGQDAAGYYDLVKQAVASKKARKKAAYEAATARPDLDSEDVSGPRSITRAILKNKGLTPHRSKAVRNPRVKKRQKYEQAKKKVSSQKAVYKGGIADVSKYSGEQSGISKVVKSVRL